MPAITAEKCLRETIPDPELFEQYWNGNGDNSVCFKSIIEDGLRNTEKNEYLINGYISFGSLLEIYLSSHTASPIYKQKVIIPFFNQWVNNAAKYFGEKMDEPYKFAKYVYADKTIQLLQELQARDGKSKKGLSDNLGVSEKTIQTDLRLLSPSLKRSKTSETDEALKIGGYAVNVEIKEIRQPDNSKLYYTPNTVNPLVMLPNITQVAVLLSSLAQNEGSDVAIGIGADIWLQLSDYCKGRIKTKISPNNPTLSEFIDRIEYLIKRGHIVGFVKERDMDVSSVSELLTIACKGSRRCDIELVKDGKTIELYNQKIQILKNHYVAVSAEQPSESIDFIEEDVSYIEMV